MAFNLALMTNVKNGEPKIQKGFVALFDIMGFSQMIANNDLIESAQIISGVFHQIIKDVRLERCELSIFNLIPDYFIFSDSILVYQIPPLFGSSGKDDLSSSCFVKFCGRLTAEFLMRGLPVKGAIGRGEFAIINGQSFTGKCIVDAHCLSESLQMAGCAILPVIESEFLKNGEIIENFSEDLIYAQAPLRNSSSQKLLMINFLRHINAEPAQITRAALIEKFSKFHKGVNLEVLKKISETEKFLSQCWEKVQLNK